MKKRATKKKVTKAKGTKRAKKKTRRQPDLSAKAVRGGTVTGGAADIFQVTAGFTDINGTFDPGGRLGQIVWRLNF